LEIRWEQLQDHHDPKVIRLLEKIAALEMGESFLALVQSNQKYRPTTISSEGAAASTQAEQQADEDEAMEQENNKLPPVEEELQTLHEEVKRDVQRMDMVERKMAIDMVKDKLRLIREMKNLSNLDIYNMDLEELSMADDPSTPRKSPLNKAPLSPVQRTEALSAIKTRLSQLRESRQDGSSHFFPRTQASSDLKEIDGSPTHQHLSQKASNLLNRFNNQTLVGPTQAPPSNQGQGLDMLRNFSLEQPSHSSLPWDTNNSKNDDPTTTTASAALSPRTSNTLNEGIGALRNLSLNTTTQAAPWLAAKATANLPTTPLPSASAASF
jgi:hypothetical protein